MLSGCEPNLPYKVWDDFEQMKIDIGDHFLYPTYIPKEIDNIICQSWYNSTLFKERAKEPYYGYYCYAYTNSGYPIFSLSANDPSLDRTIEEGSTTTYKREVIESWTEKIMGIEVSITTVYSGGRTTRIVFEFDGISYGTGYESDNGSDKYTDPVQLEELLKVVTSIIEQTKEDK